MYTSSDSYCSSTVNVVNEEVSSNEYPFTLTLNNLMSGTCHVFVVRGYTEDDPGPWRGAMGQTPPMPSTTTIATCTCTHIAAATTVAMATPTDNKSSSVSGILIHDINYVLLNYYR